MKQKLFSMKIHPTSNQARTGSIDRLLGSFIFLLWLGFAGPKSWAETRFVFVQITDTHLGSPHAAAQLDSVLADLQQLNPPPTFIIHTGDQTNQGAPAELQAAHALLSRAGIPVYHIPGNHEIRWSATGKQAFEKQWGPTFQSWHYAPLQFLLLDSSMLLEQYGHFSTDQLHWLEQELKRIGPEQPLIVACHHPLAVERRYVDNEARLLEILRPYPVILFLCGHGHANDHWRLNGIDFFMTTAVWGRTPGYKFFEISSDTIRVFERTPRTHQQRCVLRRALKPARPNATPLTLMTPDLSQNGKLKLNLAGLTSPIEWRLAQEKWQSVTLPKPPSHEATIEVQKYADGFYQAEFRTQSDPGEPWLQTIPVQLKNHGAQFKWQFQTETEVQAGLYFQNSQVIIPTLGGRLIALNARHGKQQWERQLNGALASRPVGQGDSLWLTTGAGECVALVGNPPRILWRNTLSAAIFASPQHAPGRLFVGVSDGRMMALHSASGKKLWEFQTAGLIKCQPALAHGILLFGSWDGYFYAVNTADGTLRWKYRISENPFFPAATSNPLAVGDQVMVNSHDHTLHAFEINTGTIRWQHRQTESHHGGYSSPAVYQNMVLSGSLSGHLFALDLKTGVTMWTTTLGQPPDLVFDSSPVIAGDRVYVGSIGGVLYGVDLKTPTDVWRYQVDPGYIFATSVATPSGIVVAGLSGRVLAFSR